MIGNTEKSVESPNIKYLIDIYQNEVIRNANVENRLKAMRDLDLDHYINFHLSRAVQLLGILSQNANIATCYKLLKDESGAAYSDPTKTHSVVLDPHEKLFSYISMSVDDLMDAGTASDLIDAVESCSLHRKDRNAFYDRTLGFLTKTMPPSPFRSLVSGVFGNPYGLKFKNRNDDDCELNVDRYGVFLTGVVDTLDVINGAVDVPIYGQHALQMEVERLVRYGVVHGAFLRELFKQIVALAKYLNVHMFSLELMATLGQKASAVFTANGYFDPMTGEPISYDEVKKRFDAHVVELFPPEGQVKTLSSVAPNKPPKPKKDKDA